jgi:hypothetical protein
MPFRASCHCRPERAYHWQVEGALAREIRSSLAASREDADRILATAESRARQLSEFAQDADRALADARLERLGVLRMEIEAHQERIEAAYLAMAEAMAATAMRLTKIAREADFSIPPWPGGIRTALELKLTETREMTIRVARETTSPAPPVEGSRIAPSEERRSE